MQNKVYSYYKDLPPWAKGVVVVGGGLVFALVGFKIYKAVFPSGIDRKNRELLNTADKEIRDNLNKGIKPSFSDLNYIAFANTIYDGMRYCVGDDY
jgi:hypothetical protein